MRRSTPAGRHKRGGMAAPRLQPGSGAAASQARGLLSLFHCSHPLPLLPGLPCPAAIKAPATPGAPRVACGAGSVVRTAVTNGVAQRRLEGVGWDCCLVLACMQAPGLLGLLRGDNILSATHFERHIKM